MSLPDSAVEAIKQSVAPQIVTIGGEQFLNRVVHRPPTPPEPEALKLSTLSGIVAWIKDFPDDAAKKGVAGIHICGPNWVEVIGSLSDKAQRFSYIDARAQEQRSLAYGTWYSQEDFLVRIKCGFVDDGNLKTVARIAGNVIGKDEQTSEDDGFSQTVGIKKGISAVEKVEIPNPVTLAPYRTFTEIDQPASKFLFRFRKTANEPQFALFAVEDNRWMEVARESIKEYLVAQLGDKVLPIIL